MCCVLCCHSTTTHTQWSPVNSVTVATRVRPVVSSVSSRRCPTARPLVASERRAAAWLWSWATRSIVIEETSMRVTGTAPVAESLCRVVRCGVVPRGHITLPSILAFASSIVGTQPICRPVVHIQLLSVSLYRITPSDFQGVATHDGRRHAVVDFGGPVRINFNGVQV